MNTQALVTLVVITHAVTATYLSYKEYAISTYDPQTSNVSRLLEFNVKSPSPDAQFFPTDAAWSNGNDYIRGWSTEKYGSLESTSCVVTHNINKKTTEQGAWHPFYIHAVHVNEKSKQKYVIVRGNDTNLLVMDLTFEKVLARFENTIYHGSVFNQTVNTIYLLTNPNEQGHTNTTLSAIDMSTLQTTTIGNVGQYVANLHQYQGHFYVIYNQVDPKESEYLMAIYINKICPKEGKVVKTYEYKNFHKRRAPLYAQTLNQESGEIVFVWSLWNYDANNEIFNIDKWTITSESSAMAMSDLISDLMFVQ